MPAAPGPVRVLTIEGESIDAAWSGVDAAGAILFERNGRTMRLPPSRLMTVSWVDARPVDAPTTLPATVYLADGSRLHARVTGGDARHIEIKTAPVARLQIPLDRLAAIRFSHRRHAAAREAFDRALVRRDPSQDVLLVVREDRVGVLRGVTESLCPDGGAFKWRGRGVPIDPEKTYGLVLAAGVHREPVPRAVCELRDGSAWGGRITGGNAGEIELELTVGRTIKVRVAELSEIRFHSDRVVFLSDLQPAAYEFEPFATTRWPYRRNRSTANRPMRIGNQVFDRGIGMHSKATLTYELPDRFTHLAAVIGIDEAVGPLGNAVFQVIADGEEVFDSGPVTGRDDARAILVPIGGAEKLQLVVDFGEDLDIGDQADWGNARLIKPPPGKENLKPRMDAARVP